MTDKQLELLLRFIGAALDDARTLADKLELLAEQLKDIERPGWKH